MYIVGIVGRAYQNKDSQNIIQIHEATRKFLSNQDDVVCIGLLPTEDYDYFDIEVGSDEVSSSKMDYILDQCDAFIIPGGTYGYCFDEYVIRYAIEHDKPLLAICLGFQIMCSMFCKDRKKFDMTRRLDDDSHLALATTYKHKVSIYPHTLLSDVLKKEKILVNSVHHDIVSFDMDKLVINALSDDGIIEGVEYPGKSFILGLQWHPEYLNDNNSLRIKNAFMKALYKK